MAGGTLLAIALWGVAAIVGGGSRRDRFLRAASLSVLVGALLAAFFIPSRDPQRPVTGRVTPLRLGVAIGGAALSLALLAIEARGLSGSPCAAVRESPSSGA